MAAEGGTPPPRLVIDVDAEADNFRSPKSINDKPRKTTVKRKRASPIPISLSHDQKASQIQSYRHEIQCLFKYYHELMATTATDGSDSDSVLNIGLTATLDDSAASAADSAIGMVALLMEESDLPLSKLVDEIHARLTTTTICTTKTAVKSAVLSVGQRVMYGVPNPDADLLEDHTSQSLWCWEARDLKLMPKSARNLLKIRRVARRKIHERIVSVSAMLTALGKSETDEDYTACLIKASEKLGKTLREADIRSLADGMLQKNKNSSHKADKEAKQNEKQIKQPEKTKEADEKKKEQKRLLEAEKDERRREKEEAELKKQRSIQKQASIMERFLKRRKTNSPCQNDQTSDKVTTSDESTKENKVSEAVTMRMDYTLSSNDDMGMDDIRKLHLSSWRHLGHSIRTSKKQHWGLRQKPKTELFKELKLTAIRELPHDDDSSVEKLVNEWSLHTSDEDRSCSTNISSSSETKKCKQGKQLLQFDKSSRPAFYGIWPNESQVVGARHPFRKDPGLDYEVDSDEEWEEEDPGESLSDCDKDDEESLEEGCSKADDEEESEDGFFVPDGYLSENEGVQVDRMEIEISVEQAQDSHSCKRDLDREEFCALLQRQKYLNNLTDSALRKNQPLIISNLIQAKVPLLMGEDIRSPSKLEKTFLQALSMQIFPGGPLIDISMNNMQDEDRDACVSSSKENSTTPSTGRGIKESDMPVVVTAILSCSQSINKVVESLQQSFPTVPKSQLKSKVREISEFMDNRWQVKKEFLDEFGSSITPVLDEFGSSITPEQGVVRRQNISTFFSKRCLPLADQSINSDDRAQPSLTPDAIVEGQQACSCTYSHP